MPKDLRPRLCLHSLSLGALNSEQSTDFNDVVADLIKARGGLGRRSAVAVGAQ
jgi:uncharacterized membrane protein